MFVGATELDIAAYFSRFISICSMMIWVRNISQILVGNYNWTNKLLIIFLLLNYKLSCAVGMMPGQSDIVEGDRTAHAIQAANIAAHLFKTVLSDENSDSVNKYEQDLDCHVEGDGTNIEIGKSQGKVLPKK